MGCRSGSWRRAAGHSELFSGSRRRGTRPPSTLCLSAVPPFLVVAPLRLQRRRSGAGGEARRGELALAADRQVPKSRSEHSADRALDGGSPPAIGSLQRSQTGRAGFAADGADALNQHSEHSAAHVLDGGSNISRRSGGRFGTRFEIRLALIRCRQAIFADFGAAGLISLRVPFDPCRELLRSPWSARR